MPVGGQVAPAHQQVRIKLYVITTRYESDWRPASTLRISEELSTCSTAVTRDTQGKSHGTTGGYASNLKGNQRSYDRPRLSIGRSAFMTIWREIWDQMTAHDSTSIDNIVTHLADGKMLHLNTDSKSLNYARNLVFAMIGWQTMLYRPDMRSCPPVQRSPSQTRPTVIALKLTFACGKTNQPAQSYYPTFP